MFNDDELMFINETAIKDLNAVDQKIKTIIDEIARLGKNLADVRMVQLKLQSIVQAISERKEHDSRENSQSRCC